MSTTTADDDPRDPGPVRPRSLRTRLVVVVLGLVLVTAGLIGAFSTLMLRYTLMGHLDEKLTAASERAATRRQALVQDDQSRTGLTTPGGPVAPGDEHSLGKDQVAPGLDAAGQPTGTLAVIIPGSGENGTGSGTSLIAGYIDSTGHYVTLSDLDHVSELLPVTADSQPRTVHIDSLGDYRVMASRDEVSGDVVIIGLSMEEDNSLVRTQLLIEAGIAAVGALVVALVGQAMVRSSLAPLERVAHTAQRVASQPLERGEVSIKDRVPAKDLASSTEVSQVGTALNTLLGHVESALAARQRSETQVRQFVADASHELRTPLASIRGYTELIQRAGVDAELPEDAVHALQRVHSESLRMTALVEDLLLLASLDAGRELETQEVDLVGILVDAVADAQAAGPDHDWQLRLEALEPLSGTHGQDSSRPDEHAGAGSADNDDTTDSAGSTAGSTAGGDDRAVGTADGDSLGRSSRPQEEDAQEQPDRLGEAEETEEEMVLEPPLVMGEEPRLRQVVVNLLANARVHTPAGTQVVTTLLRRGDRLVVRIADDGPGISPSVRDRLFERFARADSSRERRTGSTGLGMSIALAIVQSHHGTLTVDSRTPEEDPDHHGTTFTLELPAAEVQ